ncbi:hypothetical protein [Halopelagius longus]|uniref:DUF5658 domain-containing protein n=1 Tax=Halopelagius longus TaxID=1236180 RepID=A0A1H1ED79_9EURY|nr:hypothetical protein [Halopelagius longus]RDI71708.1 hypothetical protein DWB78_08200 [Halopelagius longus]SDQ86722.1 hypothetical protein SAMN05216278_2851 [Halopelagius longus]
MGVPLDVVSLSPAPAPSPLEAVLWALAVVFYGVGDYVTTVAAASRPDAEERNPIVRRVFAAPLSPLVSFALLKAAAFGCFLAGYLFVGSSPVRPAIPGAVALVGVVVTLQNIRVLQR